MLDSMVRARAFFLWLFVLATQGADPSAAIDALLAQVPKGAVAAVAMSNVTDRHWIIRRNAEASLSLASTTKLIVASATLLGLGENYTFSTKLVGLGAIDANGSLPGLGIIGGGSPCFDEHFAPGRDPDNVFRSFATELSNRGVRRIDGDLVIDATLFSGPIRPTTWPDDQSNQQRWFSAPAAAFAWNDNCIEVRIVPQAVGKPCVIQTRPDSSRIRIINQTRSLASGAGRNAISRSLSSNTVTVSGTCGQPTAWFPLAIESEPDLLIGDHFKKILISAGIPVTGEVRLGSVAADAGPLLIDSRQPLIPAINIFNQHSHNFYGEQFLRLLGINKRGEGSISAGCLAVTTILDEQLGTGMGPVTVLDGCGLSYGCTASATYLVNLLDGMHRHPLGVHLRASLKDRPAVGVRGLVKTGTHNEARALAGYLDAPGGQQYAFAILLNRAQSSSIAWADKLREQLYQALAAAVAR
jgi:D-alanyl-D-alanine carboxypeptidase/D-alanyl-D-alanine-endopeptidase (penicillin-binding protein 4)